MKISVLVPVYGVEKYIGRCAETLFSQTYDDLELIFVDDCSPDDSMAVLNEVLSRFPQRQSQVHVIKHEHNRGLGAARQTGLQAATGDFLFFVDSDDYVSTDAIELLCKRQKESGADMVDGGFAYVRSDDSTEVELPFHGDTQVYHRLMLVQNTVPHQIWSRLIRRSLLLEHGINFVEGVNMAEDYLMMARLCLYCRRAVLDHCVYYYREDNIGTFKEGLSSRHIGSYLRAHQMVYDFYAHGRGSASYRYPLDLGMVMVCVNALKAGLPLTEVLSKTGYRPASVLPRICLGVMRLPYGRVVARWLYLVLKRIYVMTQV